MGRANVGPLYLDPGSGSRNICDSNSALALDATSLDQFIAKFHTLYPSKPITVIANSMGGAITRGWLRLAQARGAADSTLKAVDSVIFLEGAQQGSIWAGLAELGGAGRTIYRLADHTPLVSGIAKKINLDPNRPGIKDLAPQSKWYQSVNPVAPPTHIAYFNFATNIHINLKVDYWFATSQIAAVGLGDYVMLPGSNKPTATPMLGGEDFLPGGRNIPDIHQYLLNDKEGTSYSIVINPLNGAIAVGLIAVGGAIGGPAGATVGALLAIANFFPKPALSDPTDHFNFPSNTGNGKVFVKSCNGKGTQTPTQAILGIVANPMNACP